MKTKTREIKQVLQSQPVMEGAGVRLKRGFGYYERGMFDPFLLLDDFHSDNPDDYIRGFPWHPHRGIETITYVLDGEVEHQDSIGNRGVISSGDVQWMTAGSGIVHQEMPLGNAGGRMWGFQLWANLPGTHKMMQPRYQELKSSQIPQLTLPDGSRVKIICGKVGEEKGPVNDIISSPQYLDVFVAPDGEYVHSTAGGHRVIAYVFEGEGHFSTSRQKFIGPESVILFDQGEEMKVQSGTRGVRFLLMSGQPINEPIAWKGPIVMNTDKELDIAFKEYHEGTFIK